MKFSILNFQFSKQKGLPFRVKDEPREALKAQCGQAMIMLLFFTLIAMTITASAVAIIYTNATSESKLQQGLSALDVAESGVDNAILRLIRDPSYTGETFNVGDGTANVKISLVNGVITATSSGTLNNNIRKIQVTAMYNNTVISIISWKEIF